MKKEILRQANEKFSDLSKKYDGFINVVVDDWRGFRFIFDTKDVRQCDNQCDKCPLYLLLKGEKPGFFSAELYPTGEKDKKLFGKQNFLNCKTLDQYRDCYVNFLIKKARTKKEIEDELNLIKELRIIFSKNNDADRLGCRFKNSIIAKSLKLANKRKKKIIQELIAKEVVAK